jgi:hypothetical protein
MLSGRLNPEILLAIAVLVLAALAARFPFRFLSCWERPLARLAGRKTLSICIAALSPLILRALLLPWFPAPEPRYHDEFSFLLGADTLAHGRLVNPQHPLWMHFESMHILARPVYSTAFPLGPAAALALGKVVFGSEWAGVWLSTAFMCGALCWMLQGWLPPRWALLGALLAVLRFGVASYWMNTYWGGSLAAAGGALVLGAWPRLAKKPARLTPRWTDAVILGVGLAILANTRTFEGAVLGLAVSLQILPILFKTWRHTLVPATAVLALTAAGMGFYFARVTGKPWVAPYVLYRNTLSIAPHFLWQKPTAEPLYNNQQMRDFYVGWEMDSYRLARGHMLADLWIKLNSYWRFFFGPLFSLAFLAVPWLWRQNKFRRLCFVGAAFSLSLLGQVWHIPHYAAPATGLVILIVMVCLRHLRLHPIGMGVARVLPWACAAMLAVRIAAGPAPPRTEEASWRWPARDGLKRANILRQLQNSGGKHLVIVRYGTSHDSGDEWVYNDADIDASQVVWARELDPASNAKLLRYFGDRQVWLVEPDASMPQAVPYRDAPFRPMPFVQIGAPGIAALDPANVRRAVLEHAPAVSRLSCDQWNFVFTQATGVAGPACDRGADVTFEEWFAWLQRQR